MPELPEVETVRRGLAPVLEGALIREAELRRSGLRFPFPPGLAKNLQGQKIGAVRRRAKYLLAELENGQTLISHLGMSGSWRIEKQAEQNAVLQKHDHVILRIGRSACESGGSAHREEIFSICYNDPRRFGFLLLADTENLAQHPLLAKLGIEPLGNALNAAFLQQALAGKKASLKSVLLDQRIIAGLGNIYVCEALWRAELSPWRQAQDLAAEGSWAAEKSADLTAAIRSVLEDALQSGGSHLRNYRQADGSLGYFQHQFQVYGREGKPCRRCGAAIKRQITGGRSGFYCEKCQK